MDGIDIAFVDCIRLNMTNPSTTHLNLSCPNVVVVQVLSLALNAIGSVGASELATSLRRGACRNLEVYIEEAFINIVIYI
jgi:hypothetical protein